MRTTLAYLTLGLALMGCKIQRTLDTSPTPETEGADGRGIKASITSNSSGGTSQCTVAKVALDGPELPVVNDTFVWAYTSVPYQQYLKGYLYANMSQKGNPNYDPITRDMAWGEDRALQISFYTPAGYMYDFVRQYANSGQYYNAPAFGAFAFDLGTQTKKLPQSRRASTPYYADTDGILQLSAWTPATGYSGTDDARQSIGILVGSSSSFTDENYVAFDSDFGNYRAANATAVVRKGDWYQMNILNTGSGSKSLAYFTPLDGLSLGSYQDRTAYFNSELTETKAGFVTASAYTGGCFNYGYPFQKLDAKIWMKDGWQRVAVKAAYGERRSVSITFAVGANQPYKVEAYCTDKYTDAILKFVSIK